MGYYNNMCSSCKKEPYMNKCKCMEEYLLAMAYVPWQEWRNVMCAKEGMCYGTIFKDLVLPFYGCKKGYRG